MGSSRVAIIIPALNEADSIEGVVRAVTPWGKALVIDDGSVDGTGAAATHAGALVIRHASPQGYDSALQEGFARAALLGYRFAVTFDADGQHDAAALPAVLDLLESGSDLVVGVRPHAARLSEALFAVYTRAAYGIRDPLCGLKGYSLRLFAELGHFDSYRSIGTELMLFAARSHCAISQLPVEIAPRRGASGFGGALRGNWRITRSLAIAMGREFGRRM